MKWQPPHGMVWVQNTYDGQSLPFLWTCLPNHHLFSAQAEHSKSGKLRVYFHLPCVGQGYDKKTRFQNYNLSISRIIKKSRIIQKAATTPVNFKAGGRRRSGCFYQMCDSPRFTLNKAICKAHQSWKVIFKPYLPLSFLSAQTNLLHCSISQTKQIPCKDISVFLQTLLKTTKQNKQTNRTFRRHFLLAQVKSLVGSHTAEGFCFLFPSPQLLWQRDAG